MTITEPPARGTRPGNRRALILDAAGKLFAEHGFEHVSLGDIATAVGVGPSALYRHFSSKDQLLQQVVEGLVDSFGTAVEGASDELASTLAGFALDHHSSGALWEREARHLPDDLAFQLRNRVRAARDQLNVSVRSLRPELPTLGDDIIGSAALAVVVSPSFHRPLSRSLHEEVLARVLDRILWTPLAEAEIVLPPPPTRVLTRVARSERILDSSLRLFAESSFARGSVEELGSIVGVSTATVYQHFSSKRDLLLTGLQRAHGHLQIVLDEVLTTAPDARSALDRLVDAYARFALAHPHLVHLLLTETHRLAEPDLVALVLAQRDYVSEWVGLLEQVSTSTRRAELRVCVHAALMVVNVLARHPALRERPAALRVVSRLARRALVLTQGS